MCGSAVMVRTHKRACSCVHVCECARRAAAMPYTPSEGRFVLWLVCVVARRARGLWRDEISWSRIVARRCRWRCTRVKISFKKHNVAEPAQPVWALCRAGFCCRGPCARSGGARADCCARRTLEVEPRVEERGAGPLAARASRPLAARRSASGLALGLGPSVGHLASPPGGSPF